MSVSSKFRWLFIAGLCGGLAEVLWIGAYCLIYDIHLSMIGTAISATVFPGSELSSYAPYAGLGIHLVLSIALALGFGTIAWPYIGTVLGNTGTMILSIATLALVWKVNFYLVLPVLNPDFINMFPIGITLISKLIFGTAMGLTLLGCKRQFASKLS